MFIGKTALVLSGSNLNISPATGIESLYYEQAKLGLNNLDASISIYKQSVAKHMAIQLYYNDYPVLNFKVISNNENYDSSLLFGYKNSSILFLTNKTSYEIKTDGSVNIDGISYSAIDVLTRNIYVSGNNDIIAFNASTYNINPYNVYISNKSSYLSVNMAEHKYDLSKILSNYISIPTLLNYNDWIETNAIILADKAYNDTSALGDDTSITINNISNFIQILKPNVIDISNNIITNHLDEYTENRMDLYDSSLSLELLKDKIINKKLLFGKLYKFKYNASTLHGNVFPGNTYDDHEFWITSICDTSSSISSKVSASKITDDEYFKDSKLENWTILYDNTYLANVKLINSSDIWYHIENTLDILKYYTVLGQKISDIRIINTSNNITNNSICYNKNILFFINGNESFENNIKTINANSLICYNSGPDIFCYDKDVSVTLENNKWYIFNASSFTYNLGNTNLIGISLLNNNNNTKNIDITQSIDSSSYMYGKIVYMVDEFGNEAPYDFKNKKIMGNTHYTFPNIENGNSGNKLFNLTLQLPANTSDFKNSSIISFVETYINKVKVNIYDISNYIDNYYYSLKDEGSNPLIENTYIDFIFEYSNNDSDISGMYGELKNLITYYPDIHEVLSVDNYNKIRFIFKSPNGEPCVELTNLILQYFGMTYETFINELSSNIDPVIDSESATYTFKLPYCQIISKGSIGIDYSKFPEECTISKGWYSLFKNKSNDIYDKEGYGIISPCIVPHSVYKSQYKENELIMGDKDNSLTGFVIGNIIRNNNTLIAGNTKNNYVGYDNTNIKLFNSNDKNWLTNITIGNGNDTIYIDGESNNTIIGNNNSKINIIDSSNIKIGNKNKLITINTNGTNTKIYNECNDINIGDGSTISLNNIIYSYCSNSKIIGSNNIIYQNNSNISCVSTYMVTIGQNNNIILELTYHDNNKIFLNLDVISNKNNIDNYLVINKLVLLDEESVIKTYDKNEAYNEKLNTWVIPSSIGGNPFNINAIISSKYKCDYNFYDIADDMSVKYATDENIYIKVNSTKEQLYDSWFEYDKVNKLLKNLQIITYNGDINTLLYIDSSGAKDGPIGQEDSKYVYIEDSSKHISSYGTFYKMDNSIYINLIENKNSISFTINGYILPEIYSYKLIDISTNHYVSGYINNDILPIMIFNNDDKQNIIPSFKSYGSNSLSVTLTYQFGVDSLYRSSSISGVKNPLLLSFYNKSNVNIDDIYINIALLNSSIGLEATYKLSRESIQIIYVDPSRFKGIITENSSSYMYWQDSDILNYYLLITDEMKRKFLSIGIKTNTNIVSYLYVGSDFNNKSLLGNYTIKFK